MFRTYRWSDRKIPERSGRGPDRNRDKPIVVIVPGLTGASLRDPAGHLVWGSPTHLLYPHDGGYALARPISPDADTAAGLRASAVIEYLRLGPLAKRVYGPIAETFEKDGYIRGELGDAPADGDMFLFSYDWRQDNVASAIELHRQLERLRASRGMDKLSIVLIGQSSGAHICRYFVRFADSELEQAESLGPRPPATIEVEKLVLIASANGGSIRNLRELHRGRRYLPVLGRRVHPETLFTFVTLIQDLPTYRDDLFLDSRGAPLKIDLYDPEAWEFYGWSIFRPEVRERLKKSPAAIFGTQYQRREYLAFNLDRAKRFRSLLQKDCDDFAAPPLFMIQSDSQPTCERAVSIATHGEWDLAFTGDKMLAGDQRLYERVTAGGDTHATVGSQLALSNPELRSLQEEPFFFDRGHFRLSFGAEVLHRLLEIV